jgi:hypothetical protein
VLSVYSFNKAEVPGCSLPVLVFRLVWHCLVGLYIVVVVIFVFNGSFIEDLRGADMVHNLNVARDELRLISLLRFGYGGRLF